MLYPDRNLQKRTQQNTTRYRTALYLRLSREDGDKTESDSIANQRILLEAYAIPMKQSFRQSSLNWCSGFWKPKHAGRTMPKRWPCLQAFSTVGTAAAGWCAGRPAIRESGISIISAPVASRTRAAARAIICGMKSSITLCGMRSRCRSRS